MIDPSTGQIKIPQQDVSRSGALSMDVGESRTGAFSAAVSKLKLQHFTAPEDSNVRPPISMEGVAATGVAAGDSPLKVTVPGASFAILTT